MTTIPVDLEVGTKRTEILNNFCGQYGYTDTVKNAEGVDIPNPVTKAAFLKQKVAEFVKESAAAYVHSQREVVANAEAKAIADTYLIS